jgi:hypothetical protein
VKTYEYKMIDLLISKEGFKLFESGETDLDRQALEDNEKKMNELGQDGWRLVNAFFVVAHGIQAVFMREKAQ